jgi:hypothetical protein
MTEHAQAVSPHLFGTEGQTTYAVLDGASCPDLLESLARHGAENICLYRGELKPDLARAAPYLVRLEEASPFTAWLLNEGWGNHWGIFATAPADLRAMRKHFRHYLIVKAPDGRSLYFRYYDPRVLRVYLPTCTAAESAFVFGPITSFACEGEDSAVLLRFSPGPDGPAREEVPTERIDSR